MKVEVVILGSPSLIVHMVSVDVKQQLKKKKRRKNWSNRAQELCESRGGRPGLPVLSSPYGLCGRKATSKEEEEEELVKQS